MTKNRALFFIAAALLAAVMAAPVMADQACYDNCIADGGDPATCRQQCFTGGDDRDPVARIAAWLDLSDDQIGEWTTILDALADAITPLHEQIRILGLQIREEMGSDRPDATLIGQWTLEMRSLEEEIWTIRTQAIADMIAVLTPEQVETLASRALAGLLTDGRGGDRGRPRQAGGRIGRGGDVGGDRP